MLLGSSLGFLDVLEVGCTEGTKICISDGRVLGKKLGTFDGTEIGLSWCSSTADWTFEGSVDIFDLDTNESSKIG